MVLRTLTEDEKEARERALADSRCARGRGAQAALEDASRRAEIEERDQREREAAEARKAEEEARRKAEAEAKRRGEETARRLEPRVGMEAESEEEAATKPRQGEARRSSCSQPAPKSMSKAAAASSRSPMPSRTAMRKAARWPLSGAGPNGRRSRPRASRCRPRNWCAK